MNLFSEIRSRMSIIMLVLAIGVLTALPAFAQTDPPVGPEIDFTAVLGDFWATFNEFFGAFAPIILPILAIPAAFAFLMFVGNLLYSAFTRLKGMTGTK